MRLLAMPMCRRKSVDVADRRRAAERFQPAAPPTGGGEVRVKHIGLKATSGRGKPWDREQVAFAVDAESIERNIGGEKLGVRPAAARYAVADKLIGRRAPQQSQQKCFGAGQFRGRYRVQHPWSAAGT